MLSKYERNQLIKQYFLSGFSYNEIIAMLEGLHQAKLSLRQLNRILRDEGMFRRHSKSSLDSVIDFVDNEIKHTSGSCFGYRLMHQTLRSKGYVVDRETVRHVLKSLDPDGVDMRSRKKLKRRKYVSPGPNFTWHIDGYDKLKPFGFPIHAGIDGFSRKILWLTVGTTNNDPHIIATNFIECIKGLKMVPRLVRSDRGSENIIICGLQRFFRRNHDDSHAAFKSFLYGTSTSNQRIESWWSIFRKSRITWWINFFKDIVAEGKFDPSLNYHIQFARLCFMKILQNELDETRNLWNSHRIRNDRNSECPGGRPDYLYYLGGIESGYEVDQLDLQSAEEQCNTDLPNFGCSQELIEFARIVAEENNLSTEHNKMHEAKILFFKLLEEIESL